MSYTCIDCGSIYDSTEERDCEYGEWKYIGNQIDAIYCNLCASGIERSHQHEEIDVDTLEYQCVGSNHIEGTHTMQASYLCNICGEDVCIQKEKFCEYKVSYKKNGQNDVHIEAKDCPICGDHKEKEDTCIPIGELMTIAWGPAGNIFDYYECQLCGDMCQRVFHTVHRFGPWENRDEDTHIRYCVCGSEALGGREIAPHDYKYDKDNYTGELHCDTCGASKPVVEHDHGYDTHDEMGIMDVFSSPSYGELISKSQIPNPNPSPESWCSRYEYRCKVCGLMYYVEYAHRFVDGKCTRVDYCNGIEKSADIAEVSLLEEETKETETQEMEERKQEETE